MARLYYYVVTAGNRWEIKFERQPTGERYLYDTQAEAIDAAAWAAETEHQKAGRLTGVRIQALGSQWRDERTYGADPYPPRG
ncbi:MAG TPA: hypothetical protein VIT66_06040 [Lysobacter sp.]